MFLCSCCVDISAKNYCVTLLSGAICSSVPKPKLNSSGISYWLGAALVCSQAKNGAMALQIALEKTV